MTGLLTNYLGRGLFANRPVTPDIATGALAFYYAEDTVAMYAWNNSTVAWDRMVVADAPADSDMYVRLNNAWVVLPDYPDVPDVPAPDGLIYAIKDGAWFLIPDPSVAVGDLTDVDLTGLADGYVLKYDLGTMTWKVAAESGGGGGSSFERTRVVPLAADFAIQNNGAGGAAVTITDTTYGLQLDTPSATSEVRFLKSNTAPPATPYTVILRSTPINLQENVNFGFKNCLILRNSGSGKLILFGTYNSQILLQNWDDYHTFNSNIMGPSQVSLLSPWYSVVNNGTNLDFRISPDGEAWCSVQVSTLASFIGSIDQVGFGNRVNSAALSDIFQSFEVV